jgi:hypothetical protein
MNQELIEIHSRLQKIIDLLQTLIEILTTKNKEIKP